MADAVTSQILLDGERLFLGKYTNISDGTGESAVTKIDVSTLAVNGFGHACSGIKINKIWASTYGMGVDILWDADTDVLCTSIPAEWYGEMDYCSFGGLPNNAGAGVTGDVKFTTVGHALGDRYTIIIEGVKTYV